jgi:hypothetical protein
MANTRLPYASDGMGSRPPAIKIPEDLPRHIDGKGAAAGGKGDPKVDTLLQIDDDVDDDDDENKV